MRQREIRSVDWGREVVHVCSSACIGLAPMGKHPVTLCSSVVRGTKAGQSGLVVQDVTTGKPFVKRPGVIGKVTVYG